MIGNIRLGAYKMDYFKTIKLKTVMIIVMIGGFFLTIAAGGIGSYYVIKNTMMKSTLNDSYNYAEKLAISTNQYIKEAKNTLQYSATKIENNVTNMDLIEDELERLHETRRFFDSNLVTNAQGDVTALMPHTIEAPKNIAYQIGVRQALDGKKPMIIEAERRLTGRKLILLTTPLFDEQKNFQGLLAGSIYLDAQNILYEILGNHPHDDESIVYVVDEQGEVILHHNAEEIGKQIDDELLQALLEERHGQFEFSDDNGDVKTLIGYSTVALTGWRVVFERPYDLVTRPTSQVLGEIAFSTMPWFVALLILIIFATYRVSAPIQELTELTEKSLESSSVEELKHVKSWYAEVTSLKKILIKTLSALHNQVAYLQDKSVTDELTGLTNRRTMTDLLEKWTENNMPYAVIMLDLDHFKRVNDTYGHLVGDDVLRYFAKKLKSHADEQDICCRYGGEEFIILLPHQNTDDAYALAEKIRADIAATISPTGEQLTVSCGAASNENRKCNEQDVINIADKALYLAKESGRNRVCRDSDLRVEELDEIAVKTKDNG